MAESRRRMKTGLSKKPMRFVVAEKCVWFDETLGTKIHAIMDQEFIDRFYKRVIEDKWITISGFKLAVASGSFRPVPHRFVMRWQSTTVVRDLSPVTLDNYYSFASFEDVKGGLLGTTYCVDLIGQVVCVGNNCDEGPPAHDWDDIYLELEDKEDNRLICRLPSDYAQDFFTKWRHSVDAIIICIIRFARLEVNAGSWIATTAFACTKVLINPDCREAIDMRTAIRAKQNSFG